MNLKVSNAGFAGSEGKRKKNNANTTSDVKKNAKINIKRNYLEINLPMKIEKRKKDTRMNSYAHW